MTAIAQPREWPGKWADDALCATTAPDLFHPDKGSDGEQAKAICAACPVKIECLEHALRNREYQGIWGATGPGTRKRMNRERRAA